MDSFQHAASSSGGPLTKKRKIESSGGRDRLSKLTNHALGHVLSFLPAEEAARAATLSSRWRHVFAAVHTVSLEEPERPIPDSEDRFCGYSPEWCRRSPDRSASPSFYNIVSAAIIARQRRRAAVPLRALRVAVESYSRGDALTVDQWVSYAVQQGAAEGLDLDLRLQCRSPICEQSSDWWLRSEAETEYTATRVIFSCAHLRSLSLGSCRLAPPYTVSLPSLVTLFLSHISDTGSDVERLVACCPRLADLTLEACSAVTALSIGGGVRLRRLALRCCHNLTAVAVDSSELQAFEYRGAVTDGSFLTMNGGGSTGIRYGKVDICGEEATSEEEVMNLRRLLQLFVNAKRLHLESARLGSGLDKGVPIRLPCFSSLVHLEMRGCLPDGEDATGAAIAAVSTVLEHAPNLETLWLAFHSQEHDSGGCPDYIYFSEERVLEAHHLRYNPHSLLTTPSAMIPCLRNKLREINLVHYQGGAAQRALAKFLLSNAPVIDRLWCEFAEGPMWTQTQLMAEMKGWLINKSAETHFA